MTAISVVIPSRNEGQRVFRTVRSIVSGRSCAFPLEVVVVDDASTDGSCARLADAVGPAPNFRLVVRRLDRWSGIPFARNRGAEVANHSVVVITDANTYYPRNWDVPIRQHFSPGRILAGTIVDEATGARGYGLTLDFPSMGVRWLPTTLPFGGYVPVASCACTVIDKRLFLHLGGYDEALPLYGAAEPEFSVRAWLSGHELVSVPQLLVYHRFRPSHDRAKFQELNSRTLVKNYLRFACYYLPQELQVRVYEHYAALSPHDLEAFLTQPDRDKIWSHRKQLMGRLPLSFHWYLSNFAINLLHVTL